MDDAMDMDVNVDVDAAEQGSSKVAKGTGLEADVEKMAIDE